VTKAELLEHAEGLGLSGVGVCDPAARAHSVFFAAWLERGNHGTMDWMARNTELRGDPLRLMPSAKSIVMVSLNYDQPLDHRTGHPKIARYALGRDYHKVLKSKLKKLGARLGGEWRACVDSAPLLEREYAHLAGLGWFGKNSCLIDSRRGSYFFLGALLSDRWIERDRPSLGGCGTCTRCIDACPTGAIVFADERWQVDSRRCISYLTIEHRGPLDPSVDLHGWTFGCDVCQEVCPFNEPRSSQPLRGQVTAEPDLLTSRKWPSLDELAQIDQDAWDRLTAGSATRRAGIEGLRRNARRNLEI